MASARKVAVKAGAEASETLKAEVDSWVIDDPDRQAEKLRRERMRHYKLARDLLLDKLDTEDMDVLEVGGGPLPLSDLLPFRSRMVVDPLADEYRAIAPCLDHVAMRAEDLDAPGSFDLAIATNSLDHVDDPQLVTSNMAASLRAGGYVAIACAEYNAFTHPHPAHAHSLTSREVHRWLDHEFETVWELTNAEHGYRYGHVLYNGRRGQPAFALLLRKCVGY